MPAERKARKGKRGGRTIPFSEEEKNAVRENPHLTPKQLIESGLLPEHRTNPQSISHLRKKLGIPAIPRKFTAEQVEQRRRDIAEALKKYEVPQKVVDTLTSKQCSMEWSSSRAELLDRLGAPHTIRNYGKSEEFLEKKYGERGGLGEAQHKMMRFLVSRGATEREAGEMVGKPGRGGVPDLDTLMKRIEFVETRMPEAYGNRTLTWDEIKKLRSVTEKNLRMHGLGTILNPRASRLLPKLIPGYAADGRSPHKDVLAYQAAVDTAQDPAAVVGRYSSKAIRGGVPLLKSGQKKKEPLLNMLVRHAGHMPKQGKPIQTARFSARVMKRGEGFPDVGREATVLLRLDPLTKRLNLKVTGKGGTHEAEHPVDAMKRTGSLLTAPDGSVLKMRSLRGRPRYMKFTPGESSSEAQRKSILRAVEAFDLEEAKKRILRTGRGQYAGDRGELVVSVASLGGKGDLGDPKVPHIALTEDLNVYTYRRFRKNGTRILFDSEPRMTREQLLRDPHIAKAVRRNPSAKRVIEDIESGKPTTRAFRDLVSGR